MDGIEFHELYADGSAGGNPVGYSKVIKYNESPSGERNSKTMLYFKNSRRHMTQVIPGMPNLVKQ